MPRFNWKRVLGWASLFGLAVFWALVVFLLLFTSSNHMGLSLLWAAPLFGGALFAGGWAWRAGDRKTGLRLMVLSLLSLLGAVLLDHFNILVEYETWLRRGMPEPPF